MRRSNFYIDDDAQIELLSKATGRSKAEVVHDALTLYNYFAHKMREGQKLYMGESKEEATHVIITQLENFRERGVE